MSVAYNGVGYKGFADQPGQVTVAGELCHAISRVLRVEGPLKLTCAGRTDAGVHALGQVVHIDIPCGLISSPKGDTSVDAPGPLTPDEFVRKVNRLLRPSIVLRSAREVGSSFDARRSALSRRYRYLIWESSAPHPLFDHLSWNVTSRLDLRAMKSASDAFVGEHDFRAFCRRPPGTPHGFEIVRRVTEVNWKVIETFFDDPTRDGSGDEGRMLSFEIVADSFCHQMVRSIVGMLVDVGRGNGNTASVVSALRASDRASGPRPAPAKGLCLVSVDYDREPDQ
ncbi:MAG: tRNA pseudouridine(38-40) synthase TruA [Actinobacteria bacterium]|nr:tRNA pseudouridine(38-40) synthase TruA [Actinomycetota bacterium]MCL5445687.1 tRNA pseudouridine(38-40) synthase TruA [Actinomycetota bacterium]